MNEENEIIAENPAVEEDREIEIIKLYGSIELAPILGMSDVIVDIVETDRKSTR